MPFVTSTHSRNAAPHSEANDRSTAGRARLLRDAGQRCQLTAVRAGRVTPMVVQAIVLLRVAARRSGERVKRHHRVRTGIVQRAQTQEQSSLQTWQRCCFGPL